jgi:hypothetical protein
MKKSDIIVRGIPEKKEIFLNGLLVPIPERWIFLPSGDPLLTRRVKAAGPYWIHIREWKGRQESIGIWTSEETVQYHRARIAAERETPEYQKKLEASRRSREKKKQIYSEEFRQAVLDFLAFHSKYSTLGEQIAEIIAAKSAAVGSGTVARTQRISVEQRAESAVIAWFRHQTTEYDSMKIARIKGRRFEVRRELAKHSRALLERFRTDSADESDISLLTNALKKQI